MGATQWSVQMLVKRPKDEQRRMFHNVKPGRCYKLGEHSFKVKDIRRSDEGKPKIEIEYVDRYMDILHTIQRR